MQYIFLDIDGVLNTHYSMTKGLALNHLFHFQKSCVRELNRIIHRTGAKIVVSSTWRRHSNWLEVINHIGNEGVVGEIIDRTGRSDDRIRGHEIADWLSQHPETESFVILDDDSDMGRLMPRLVQTSMDGGLRRHHGDLAVKILDRKWHKARFWHKGKAFCYKDSSRL